MERNFVFSQGRINRINNYIIEHTVSTKNGSSGWPILIQNSFKVIGIHKGGIKKKMKILVFFLKTTDFKNNILSSRPLTPLFSSRKRGLKKMNQIIKLKNEIL